LLENFWRARLLYAAILQHEVETLKHRSA
jgi:hypothetical protein